MPSLPLWVWLEYRVIPRYIQLNLLSMRLHAGDAFEIKLLNRSTLGNHITLPPSLTAFLTRSRRAMSRALDCSRSMAASTWMPTFSLPNHSLSCLNCSTPTRPSLTRRRRLATTRAAAVALHRILSPRGAYASVAASVATAARSVQESLRDVAKTQSLLLRSASLASAVRARAMPRQVGAH